MTLGIDLLLTEPVVSSFSVGDFAPLWSPTKNRKVMGRIRVGCYLLHDRVSNKDKWCWPQLANNYVGRYLVSLETCTISTLVRLGRYSWRWCRCFETHHLKRVNIWTNHIGSARYWASARISTKNGSISISPSCYQHIRVTRIFSQEKYLQARTWITIVSCMFCSSPPSYWHVYLRLVLLLTCTMDCSCYWHYTLHVGCLHHLPCCVHISSRLVRLVSVRCPETVLTPLDQLWTICLVCIGWPELGSWVVGPWYLWPFIHYLSYHLGNLAATAFPLFTTQMYEKLGYKWANTLFGCIATVMVPIPFVSFDKNSPFSSNS